MLSTFFEPFYASIDLRDAGFKLAPVDANLFPAGFNNVCSTDLKNSPLILRPHLMRHLGFIPEKIAILPELHTKNRYYVDNLIALVGIFRQMGVECVVGWWNPETLATKGVQAFMLEGSNEVRITAHPFYKEENRLKCMVEGEVFDPDFILVNNDFSSGYPEELDGIAQPIEPTPKLGWHTRKKSDFFHHYNRLAGELAIKAELDPWCLQVETCLVSGVNFDEGTGLDCIAHTVDELINRIESQYAKRGINENPFVFVKSNVGTYGMGIMKVRAGSEILQMNRRGKNKMAVVKNKLKVHEVIVQEGIPTRFQLKGVYSEPVIYMFGRELAGGFLRQNPEKGRDENLNSQGMVFKQLCVSDLRNPSVRGATLELVYGKIAELSSAAISLELKNKEKSC